jgi:Uma2 family endonuclease
MRAHGIPDAVLTDNGKVFTGRFTTTKTEVHFDRICRENGVRHLLTARYSPTTTGKNERLHKTSQQRTNSEPTANSHDGALLERVNVDDDDLALPGALETPGRASVNATTRAPRHPPPLRPSDLRRTIGVVSEAIAVCSLEEFLDGEQSSERRHELVGGRVYGMAGGSERHDLVAGIIYETIAAGARSRGCRPFISNRLVHTPSGNTYYPDVLVACGSAPHRLYETGPVLVVEVLSHSTGDVDRREKAVAYAEATSVRLLLLVDPDARRIEAARPAGGRIDDWTVYGRGDVVVTGYGDIDVDALYDTVDQTATTS